MSARAHSYGGQEAGWLSENGARHILSKGYIYKSTGCYNTIQIFNKITEVR